MSLTSAKQSFFKRCRGVHRISKMAGELGQLALLAGTGLRSELQTRSWDQATESPRLPLGTGRNGASPVAATPDHRNVCIPASVLIQNLGGGICQQSPDWCPSHCCKEGSEADYLTFPALTLGSGRRPSKQRSRPRCWVARVHASSSQP